MAGFIRKSLFSSAHLISRHILSKPRINTSMVSLSVAVPSQSLRKLTTIGSAHSLTGLKRHSNTCPCCKLHTDVDKDISKFLDKEIQYEESSSKSKAGLPKIQGFDVSAEDSVVTLTRKMGNESVKVVFNVNGTTDSDQETAAVGEAEQVVDDVQMISRPPFTVEVDKGSGEILAFQCSFSPLDDIEQESTPQDADAIVDLFEIHDITLHKGEWKETLYSVTAETMDGSLYDLMMDMLDERGINDDFIGEMVEFSTAYEHGKYVSFLKNLKSFIGKN